MSAPNYEGKGAIALDVLDHGFVALRNMSGPNRRPDAPFDADDIDPAQSARMSFDQMDSDHSHAQIEAQRYAQAVDQLLRQYLPNSMALYDKYRRLGG